MGLYIALGHENLCNPSMWKMQTLFKNLARTVSPRIPHAPQFYPHDSTLIRTLLSINAPHHIEGLNRTLLGDHTVLHWDRKGLYMYFTVCIALGHQNIAVRESTVFLFAFHSESFHGITFGHKKCLHFTVPFILGCIQCALNFRMSF